MKETIGIPTVTEEGVQVVTGAVKTAAALVNTAQQAMIALRARAQSARALALSDMPRGGGGPQSLDAYIIALEEKTDQLAAVGQVEERVIARVAAIIARLDDPQEQVLASILYLTPRRQSTERAIREMELRWGGNISERMFYLLKKRLLANLQAVITPGDVTEITDLLALARTALSAPRAA